MFGTVLGLIVQYAPGLISGFIALANSIRGMSEEQYRAEIAKGLATMPGLIEDVQNAPRPAT